MIFSNVIFPTLKVFLIPIIYTGTYSEEAISEEANKRQSLTFPNDPCPIIILNFFYLLRPFIFYLI